jgi:hypothetical protein
LKDPNSQSSTKPKSSKSPKTELPWYRRWLAKVWHTRGGGLYACGYAITFVYLEARTILSELFEAEGIVDFLTNQLFELIFRFLGESLMNMVQAFMWPVEIVQFWPPFGAIALGLAFVSFDKYLRKPVERWLLNPEITE